MTAAFLSAAQLAQYDRDGFLIIPHALSESDIATLKNESYALANSLDITKHPMTTFITTSDAHHVKDKYFLESGDKISFFFEEGALDPATKELCVEKAKAFNKIGHGLHLHNAVFKDFCSRPFITEIARQLSFKHPIILQSMVIFKNAKIGGKVSPHQDSTFLYTQPLSTVGMWFALDDCKAANGTLKFIPGSHKIHPINRRFIRSPGEGLIFTAPMPSFADTDYVQVDVAKGSLVLIHGSVVHASEGNMSEKTRNAFTFHLIDGDCEYDEKNWLQMTDGFKPLY